MTACATAAPEPPSRPAPRRSPEPEDLTRHLEYLDAAIAIVVRNLGDLYALERPLEELGADHARFGIGPDRLAAAHGVLLDAMRSFAGGRWTRVEDEDRSAACAALLVAMIRGARRAMEGQAADRWPPGDMANRGLKVE